MSNTDNKIQNDLENTSQELSNGINSTGENANQNIQSGSNDLVNEIEKGGDVVESTLSKVLTSSNILLIVGFLAVYFGISYFRKNGETINTEAPSRFTGMIIDLIFVIILGFALYIYIQNASTDNQVTVTSQFVDNFTDYVDNPASVMISIFMLIGLYIVVYLFGIPMNKESKPVSISILETLAWVTLVIILFVDVFKFVFGVSFDELFNKIKDFFRGETKTSTDKDIPEEKCETDNVITDDPLGEVFNVANNLYTYDDAKMVCKSYNAKLATYDQVEKAYNNGAEWCNYGWSDDQMALFPTQKDTWNKLQKLDQGVCDDRKKKGNNCGRPGVNGGYISNPYVKFGVNCYGKKPTANKKDLMRMAENEEQIYPKTPDERKLEKKINHWKENSNKYLQLNSYNTKKWTEKNTLNTDPI